MPPALTSAYIQALERRTLLTDPSQVYTDLFSQAQETGEDALAEAQVAGMQAVNQVRNSFLPLLRGELGGAISGLSGAPSGVPDWVPNDFMSGYQAGIAQAVATAAGLGGSLNLSNDFPPPSVAVGGGDWTVTLNSGEEVVGATYVLDHMVVDGALTSVRFEAEDGQLLRFEYWSSKAVPGGQRTASVYLFPVDGSPPRIEGSLSDVLDDGAGSSRAISVGFINDPSSNSLTLNTDFRWSTPTDLFQVRATSCNGVVQTAQASIETLDIASGVSFRGYGERAPSGEYNIDGGVQLRATSNMTVGASVRRVDGKQATSANAFYAVPAGSIQAAVTEVDGHSYVQSLVAVRNPSSNLIYVFGASSGSGIASQSADQQTDDLDFAFGPMAAAQIPDWRFDDGSGSSGSRPYTSPDPNFYVARPELLCWFAIPLQSRLDRSRDQRPCG